MKLSLLPTSRLHWEGLLGIAIGSLCWPLDYYIRGAASKPMWLVIAMPIFCAIALYVWLCQSISPDKTRFTPKWW
jgi:hypothetical protein